MFLEKLEAQKLVDLFTNSTKGYSVSVLAKFYTTFRVLRSLGMLCRKEWVFKSLIRLEEIP